MLRRTGPDRMHLVQVGGGPLGGDRLALDVDLGPDQRLRVRTAAATVVQPDRTGSPASFIVRAALAAGARLDWEPEPTVVCDGAHWRPVLEVDLEEGAGAALGEQVVLGRSGQRGGRCASGLRVHVAGRPLLVSTQLVDGADAALRGPGGTGGARSVGTLVLAGAGAGVPGDAHEATGEEPDVAWAWSALAGPGALLTALGSVRGVARVLARARPR